MSGTWQRLALLAATATVVSLLLVGGFSALPLGGRQGSPPVSADVTVDGALTIWTPTTYSDESVYVGGAITIESGGSLTLQNVDLTIAEPNSLEFGIVVEKGGALTSSGSTIASAVAGNQIAFTAQAGSNLSVTGGSIEDVGAASGTAGLVDDSAYSQFSDVSFSNFYEALVISAKDVTVSDCSFTQSTSGAESTWAISTSGTSAGFVMTHSSVDTPSMIGGALDLNSQSDIENNTFTLDPQGTNPTPILIGYTGSGYTNASGTKFSYNSVSGSDVVDFDSSNVLISFNKIVNTGGEEYVHDYGVRAETFNPSSGVWVNHITIEGNWISNSTSFGIRVEQNITNALIEYNTITNVSTNPQAGTYNGVETYVGIYLIRGVTHSVVYDNTVDESADQERSNLETAGIGLESEVDYCTVSDNTVLNTDLGIWVQGDWDDGPGNIGPSLYNTVTGNTFDNVLPIVQTANLASAIQNYDWANYTTISDNLIEGWNQVPSDVNGYEGEAIQQADDYGTIDGNVITGANYGIVFGFFYGNGLSNGSYNVVYNNQFDITGPAISENTAKNPGPVVNELNVVTRKTTTGGFPTLDEVAIGPASAIGISESFGQFSATLGALDPATQQWENVTSSIPWTSLPDFSIQVAGDLGTGTIPAEVTFLNATEVQYVVPSAGALTHIVSLGVPIASYSANYTVKVVRGSSSDSFPWYSVSGPADFSTTASGSLTVTVRLVNWTARPTLTSLDLVVAAMTSNGTWVSNLTVEVDLAEPSQPVLLTLGPTNATGGAHYAGLPVGTNVSNVSIVGDEYSVAAYSVGTGVEGEILLTLVVLPVGPSVRLVETGVDFEARGLDSGASWEVELTGTETVNLTSVGTTITFELPNGTYDYAVYSSSPANATPASGSFVVPGSSYPIVVNFSVTFPTSPMPGSPAAVPGGGYLWVLVLLGVGVAGVLATLVVGELRHPRRRPRRGNAAEREKFVRVRVPLGRR